MNSEFCQLQITFGTREEAEKCAKKLVERYLVACAQVVGPISSYYHWNENLETASEWLLLAKTRSCVFDEVQEAVLAGHSYEVPQIVALPIVDFSPDYLKWLKEQIR